MSVAARWASWARSHRNLPGPLLGASLAGVPFLVDVFGASARLAVEMAFGADVTASADTWSWTDITSDVRYADGGGVIISPVGRGDETSNAQPAGCAFQLDNTAGDYSKGPQSKRYPYVRRNTPVRVRLTLDGSSWYVRFQGYANGFTPSWDTSANMAVVSVSSSGTLRRLQQGTSPLRSALYRASANAAPVAYWPLEDGASATLAGSGLPGGTSMALSRPVGAIDETKFADATGTAGSDKIVSLGDGYLFASVAGGNAAAWSVEWIARYDAYSTGLFTTEMVRVAAGTTANLDGEWRVAADNVDWYLYFNSNATGGVIVASTGTQIYDGTPHHFRVGVSQNGANISAQLYLDGVLDGSGSYNSKTLKAVTAIYAGTNENYLETAAPKPAIGHLAIWDGTSQATLYSAATGYTGETATARLARLCAEQGVPINITGSSDTTMGVQGVDTFVNLLRECETTDDGVLYDGRSSGLSYTARTARYNATTALTADMSADPPQVGQPFSPVDDDQRNRNKIKVDRKDGSTATYQDSTGALGTSAIGVYDSSVTVNASDDTGLLYRAAWEVHKGTVDAPYRYPTLALDLAAVPVLAPAWLAADASSRFDVTNITSKATQHPAGTVVLLIEGWAETLSPFDWTATANCSPFSPWRVGVIEGAGDTAWRIDSGSSTVTTLAAVGDTSFSVTSTSSAEVWSTTASDYPRDVSVGGAQVTATAVSGASSPQTFTCSALTFSLPAGAAVSLWRPPTIAL